MYIRICARFVKQKAISFEWFCVGFIFPRHHQFTWCDLMCIFGIIRERFLLGHCMGTQFFDGSFWAFIIIKIHEGLYMHHAVDTALKMARQSIRFHSTWTIAYSVKLPIPHEFGVPLLIETSQFLLSKIHFPNAINFIQFKIFSFSLFACPFAGNYLSIQQNIWLAYKYLADFYLFSLRIKIYIYLNIEENHNMRRLHWLWSIIWLNFHFSFVCREIKLYYVWLYINLSAPSLENRKPHMCFFFG